jgi:hypothetical protein
MDINWQTVAALVVIVTTLNGMSLWAIKWLIERNNEILMTKFKERRRKDIDQDEEMRRIQQEQNEIKVSMPDEYMRRDDAVVYFERLDKKIDMIWSHLLKASEKSPP